LLRQQDDGAMTEPTFGINHLSDVSSGVEDAPGRKSPAKIAAFLAAAKAL
jgi:phosphoribosylanthranilate isomerase